MAEIGMEYADVRLTQEQLESLFPGEPPAAVTTGISVKALAYGLRRMRARRWWQAPESRKQRGAPRGGDSRPGTSG